MGLFGNRILSRLLQGGVVVVLLVLTAGEAAAQSWQAERKRLDAEVKKLVDKAREEGATDVSGLTKEFERLQAEFLEKVVKPALAQARTCSERMDAVELAIGLERQAQLLGTSSGLDAPGMSKLLTGTYADQTYERCMNELYRACVVEDNPLFALTMAAWAIGHERQKQLLGVTSDTELSLDRELDPRITKCRGPWYKVRIVIERSGTEPDLGPWHDRDISEGWLGRGLSRVPPRSGAKTPFPGEFKRRAEQLGYGAVCPDGGCGGSCQFLAVDEGPARVEYEPEVSHAYRMLLIGFRGELGDEKLEKNSCPHTDVPIALSPGRFFIARFPSDVVTPLTEDPQLPGGADPKLTEAIDEWPRMFGSGGVQLDDELGRPLGRLEVQSVCDGQEIWNRGSAECQQKWEEYVKAFGHEMPLAPWDRKPSGK